MIWTVGQFIEREADPEVGDVIVYEGFRLVVERQGVVAVHDDDPDRPGEPLLWLGGHNTARAIGRAVDWVDTYVEGYDAGFRAGELGRIRSELSS